MALTDGNFDGSEFTNNLFSDLAPLLALFGEQVTKQFLSTSFGWADNILLAMGPLGIITIVVSAIRVGGPKWLKALVGRLVPADNAAAQARPRIYPCKQTLTAASTPHRAREERCLAEQELLSSTSNEVCEMWSPGGIVRTKGQPPMGLKTLVIISNGAIVDMDSEYGDYFNPPDALEGSSSKEVMSEIMAKNDAEPNLALMVKRSRKSMLEVWAFASVGLVLQLGALAVIGVARYRWEWPGADGQFSANTGYPFYLLGTVLLSLGIVGCGRAIEAATVEQTLECKEEIRPHMAIVHLQQACKVGDQHFQSFAIFNAFDQPDIRISTWQSTDNR
jgi:hypothetical protein